MVEHTQAELRLLGVLEDSLGERHRATNGVTPSEAVGRETLAEMIELERGADLRARTERAEAAAGQSRPARWWQR